MPMAPPSFAALLGPQAAVKGVLGKASAAGNVVRLTALKGMGRLVGKRPAQEDTVWALNVFCLLAAA